MNVIEELEKIGAVFTNKHFVYASGKHGGSYINLDLMFPYTSLVAELSQGLVSSFKGEFDTIAAPATGGIVLAVLSSLAADSKGVWADKADGSFVFERAGFVDQIKGKRVLVVEDILNTGGSVEKVCHQIEKEGGIVVGVSVVCSVSNTTADTLNIPRLECLANVSFSTFEPDQCELCMQHIPIVENMGHADEYKSANPDYSGGYIHLAV